MFKREEDIKIWIARRYAEQATENRDNRLKESRKQSYERRTRSKTNDK